MKKIFSISVLTYILLSGTALAGTYRGVISYEDLEEVAEQSLEVYRCSERGHKAFRFEAENDADAIARAENLLTNTPPLTVTCTLTSSTPNDTTSSLVTELRLTLQATEVTVLQEQESTAPPEQSPPQITQESATRILQLLGLEDTVSPEEAGSAAQLVWRALQTRNLCRSESGGQAEMNLPLCPHKTNP